MTVCIDTNVVLGMFAEDHAHRSIFEAWFEGRLRWAVTTEIFLEYEEVMQRQAGHRKAEMMMRTIMLVDALHQNVLRIAPQLPLPPHHRRS